MPHDDKVCANVCVYVYLLGIIPLLRLPEVWRRTCRQEAVERKAKHLIHMPHEVQTCHNLFFQLARQNEKKLKIRATRGHNNVDNETKRGELKFQPGREKTNKSVNAFTAKLGNLQRLNEYFTN